MSYFKAKMHQIRFRVGLRPRPRWGSLQHSPRRHIAGFKGPTSEGRARGGNLGGDLLLRRWEDRRGRKGGAFAPKHNNQTSPMALSRKLSGPRFDTKFLGPKRICPKPVQRSVQPFLHNAPMCANDTRPTSSTLQH